MRLGILAILIITAAAGLPGCLPGTLKLPEHFVSVDEEDRGDYLVRGVSADGVVVALRSRENLKNGSLKFWHEAVRSELAGRGYRLGETEDITSDAGVAGKMMTFSVRSRGVPFTYILALYVQPRQVLIVEAGGKADDIKARLDDIHKSLLTAR